MADGMIVLGLMLVPAFSLGSCRSKISSVSSKKKIVHLPCVVLTAKSLLVCPHLIKQLIFLSQYCSTSNNKIKIFKLMVHCINLLVFKEPNSALAFLLFFRSDQCTKLARHTNGLTHKPIYMLNKW